MDELAQQMHISKKTIYKHYKSKDSLLEEICKSTNKEIGDNINSVINEKRDVVYKLTEIMLIHTNYISQIGEKWLQDLKTHTPHLWNSIEDFKKRKIELILEKLLRQGKREKLISEFHPALIIACFTSAIQAITHPEFLINNNFSMHEALISVQKFLLTGILTKKGKEKFRKSLSKINKEIKNKI